MDCNINSPSTAIEYHNDAVFNHLLFYGVLCVLSALNGGSFWFKTQQKVLRIDCFNETCFNCSFSHEVFVFLAPEGRYSQDPSDFSGNYFANLFS